MAVKGLTHAWHLGEGLGQGTRQRPGREEVKEVGGLQE